jgi:hypothetical protein
MESLSRDVRKTFPVDFTKRLNDPLQQGFDGQNVPANGDLTLSP